MRGKETLLVIDEAQNGITPAYAGKRDREVTACDR